MMIVKNRTKNYFITGTSKIYDSEKKEIGTVFVGRFYSEDITAKYLLDKSLELLRERCLEIKLTNCFFSDFHLKIYENENQNSFQKELVFSIDKLIK